MTKRATKTQTAFYRRIYVAHLIDSGVNTVPAIMEATGMPRRTAQDAISALGEIGVHCEFTGATKNGVYRVKDWGPIKPEWIQINLQHVLGVLECN